MTFIITDEDMRDFNMDNVELLEQTENTCIIRTFDLLPTLLFMQKHERKLWEMQPDDEDWIEYEILTYYKPKQKN